MGRERKTERCEERKGRVKQRDVVSEKVEQERDVVSGKGEQNSEM